MQLSKETRAGQCRAGQTHANLTGGNGGKGENERKASVPKPFRYDRRGIPRRPVPQAQQAFGSGRGQSDRSRIRGESRREPIRSCGSSEEGRISCEADQAEEHPKGQRKDEAWGYRSRRTSCCKRRSATYCPRYSSRTFCPAVSGTDRKSARWTRRRRCRSNCAEADTTSS